MLDVAMHEMYIRSTLHGYEMFNSRVPFLCKEEYFQLHDTKTTIDLIFSCDEKKGGLGR